MEFDTKKNMYLKQLESIHISILYFSIYEDQIYSGTSGLFEHGSSKLVEITLFNNEALIEINCILKQDLEILFL